MVVAILFFARIIRVATIQVRPPDEVVGGRKRSQNLNIEFIEPLERSGERLNIDTALIIGRSPECDLQMNDNFLSSRHARIASDSGELSIEDLGSTNGTYVNQQLVKGRVHLERGDIVQVGGVLFEVVR
jgi:hypothetical protein